MNDVTSILLCPFGETDATFIEELSEAVEHQLRMTAGPGPRQPVPPRAWDWRRRQYRSGAFLAWLADVRDEFLPQAPYLLGVTDEDLFVPQLNFVFGEADKSAGVAVISLMRLRQEFYGLPPNPQLLAERALKEAVHELGHVFGLTHCSNPRCIMFFSNVIEDTDRKGPEFCSKCGAQLREMTAAHRAG